MSGKRKYSKKGTGGRQRWKKSGRANQDDWDPPDIDDEIDGRATFDLNEKLRTDKFTACFIQQMEGKDFTVVYLQKNGLTSPLLFRNKAGLGITIPNPDFTIEDVRTCVGSRRVLDVMDVATQRNTEMTMKEWQKYYESPKKDRVLNVISLEFSHTKLANYVQPPSIVKQIDWVETAWPTLLKASQMDATNRLEEMKYPKVQKYCLMSVAGCYTDFHIDFGGTSVWYHVLKGAKIFWLIPPSERNLQLYEHWVLSGKQTDIFFGDLVEKCGRVSLEPGNTFFIPSGWIHAVYTPKDSLVFGGNFLHSYAIEKQLRIAQVEDTTKVPQKFRYPFYAEMLWYVLERYVHCLLGRSHLNLPGEEDFTVDRHYHLTLQEMHGLKDIIMFLNTLPPSRKNIPDLITNPLNLIQDVRTLVERHRHDKQELATSGIPIFLLHETCSPSASLLSPMKTQRGRGIGKGKGRPPSTVPKSPGEGPGNEPRRRRTRCKKCSACLREDCGQCSFCLDMVKFGGTGRAKQTCVARQCLMPLLPITAVCVVCRLDGWNSSVILPVSKVSKPTPSNLMECSVCYEIVHSHCNKKKCPDLEGFVNEDLPNSWECPKCRCAGLNLESKPRHFRARSKVDMPQNEDSVCNTDFDSPESKKCKIELQWEDSSKKAPSEVSSHESVSSPVGEIALSADCLDLEDRLRATIIKFLDKPDRRPSTEVGAVSDKISSSVKSLVEAKLAASLQPTVVLIKHEPLASDLPVVSGTKLKNVKFPKEVFPLRKETQANSQDRVPAAEDKSSVNKDLGPTGDGNSSERKGQNNCEKPGPSPHKIAFDNYIASQTRELRQPHVVVRPALPVMLPTSSGSSDWNIQRLVFSKEVLLPIFRYLDRATMLVCMRVCRAWNRVSVDPSLWKTIDAKHQSLTHFHMQGIVRRQPEHLYLDWGPVSKFQLSWFLPRMPLLKTLSLQGCTWEVCNALRGGNIPLLSTLDLSHVSGLNDVVLKDLLCGQEGVCPRLKSLTELSVSGTDITELSVRCIAQTLKYLTCLRVAGCCKLSDAGVAQLCGPTSLKHLTRLDVSGCPLLTISSLELAARNPNLSYLNVSDCPFLPAAACKRLQRPGLTLEGM